MRFQRLIAVCVLVGAMSSALADELMVSAAASLTNAFRDLAAQFEAAHPGTTVLTTFGASDVVLQQIVHGAPTDVFACADQKAMDKAVQAQVVDPRTRQNFVGNEIVLIVPADNPGNIRSAKDLHGAAVGRVALGNPASVPVGRYAQAALEASGDWSAVRQREVLGQNVRQVLSYVERGEVDAGVVFATDAATMRDKVRIVQTLRTPIPVVYPIALVKRPGRAASAQAFLDFVLSEKGQAVLAKYGFSKP